MVLNNHTLVDQAVLSDHADTSCVFGISKPADKTSDRMLVTSRSRSCSLALLHRHAATSLQLSISFLLPHWLEDWYVCLVNEVAGQVLPHVRIVSDLRPC